MATNFLLSLANIPWGLVTAYSALDSTSDVLKAASRPENHDRPLKEKIKFVLKKCIHPLVAGGMYLWSSDAAKNYLDLLKKRVSTPSQATIDDPRKLVVLVEGGTVPKLESVPAALGIDILGYISRYVPRWKEQFDFVRTRVTSVKMLDEALKKITHVEGRVKPISLLMMFAHGLPESVELDACEDSLGVKNIRNCLETYIDKDNLDQVGWKDVLAKESKILMLSCHTGSGFGNPSIGRSLATVSQTPVIAPTWQISPDTMHMDIDSDIRSISIKWLDSTFSLPGIDVGVRTYIPDGGRIYSNITGGKDPDTILPDGTKVFPHKGSPITESDLKDYIEGYQKEVPQYLMYYVGFNVAVGMLGLTLKTVADALPGVLGDRAERITGYMHQLGNVMTTFSNCALGKAPSVLYNGVKAICDRAINRTDRIKKVIYTASKSTKKRKHRVLQARSKCLTPYIFKREPRRS